MPPSDADRELRLDALVLQAAALDPGDRETFLDGAGLEDPDLVAEARRRLARAEAMPTSFLAAPTAGSDPGSTDDGSADDGTVDDEAPPESLGPYRLIRRLGEGGMGEVYEGFDDRLDRPVALKRIRPEAGDRDQARARFRREARAVARLSHSAIVQVHDWVDGEDSDWIVMELIVGRSLKEILASGPLAPEPAARIAGDIAAGLAAAHDAGIVHRDLKAANVMLTGAPGRAKILDFGIAKRLAAGAEAPLTAVTTEGKIIGTVTAMSPEQAMGRPLDHRSDLFALGALLYEMITGSPPFQGGNLVEILTRICTIRQPPACQVNPAVPEALSRLIDHLLEKEPEHRPQSAAEVVATLEAWLAGQTSDAEEGNREAVDMQAATLETADNITGEAIPGDGLTSKPRKRWLTSKSRRVLAGVFALAITVGLIWFYNLDPKPSSEAEVLVAQPLESLSDPRLYAHGMKLLEHYYRKGHIDRAIEAFQRLLAHDGESAPGHAGLSRAYWRKFQNEGKDRSWLDRALTIGQRAADLNPHLTAARISFGLVSLEMGRLDDAAREFEEVLRIQPGSADAMRGLGNLSESRGELEEAEAFYLQAVAARSRDWELQAYLGSLQSRMGSYAKAETAFKKSIGLASDNQISYRNLAALYYLTGRLSQAADMFQKALEIRPSATLYGNLGTLLFYQGLYPQAAAVFERAIEFSGGANDYRMWANLGDAYRWTPDGAGKAQQTYLRAI